LDDVLVRVLLLEERRRIFGRVRKKPRLSPTFLACILPSFFPSLPPSFPLFIVALFSTTTTCPKYIMDDFAQTGAHQEDLFDDIQYHHSTIAEPTSTPHHPDDASSEQPQLSTQVAVTPASTSPSAATNTPLPPPQPTTTSTATRARSSRAKGRPARPQNDNNISRHANADNSSPHAKLDKPPRHANNTEPRRINPNPPRPTKETHSPNGLSSSRYANNDNTSRHANPDTKSRRPNTDSRRNNTNPPRKNKVETPQNNDNPPPTHDNTSQPSDTTKQHPPEPSNSTAATTESPKPPATAVESSKPPAANAVRGDRTATGGLRKPKLSEQELADKMSSISLKNEKLAAAHARAQADAADFAEREQVAAKRRQEERRDRQQMMGEREKNRLRKLKAVGGREWDAEKPDDADAFGGPRQSAGNGRGANGAITGQRNSEASREGFGREKQDYSDGREYMYREDRGRGGGRGRGSQSRGGRGNQQPKQHPQPALKATDFPDLSAPGSAPKFDTAPPPVMAFPTKAKVETIDFDEQITPGIEKKSWADMME
jgi:hypothetical protein